MKIVIRLLRMEVLKWLHEKGAPWDGWTCAWAAGNGHLEVIKWLHKKGAPWDERACAWAAWNEHLEVLKWLLSKGCPCGESTKGIVKAKWASEEW